MGDLLARALDGVDPDAPDAAWHIFRNLMALMPWWPLFWFTIACVAVGALIGWWRGRLWHGVLWALLLGPFGWIVPLALPKRPRGRAA
ncbi:MAG TPA: hypothetical protein VF216_07590 [Mizugakiibacter sp.]